MTNLYSKLPNLSLSKHAKQALLSQKRLTKADKLVRFFYTATKQSSFRIGPHSEEMVATLIANLLSNGWAEKRGNSTRIHIHISSRNMEYAEWLHNVYIKNGYCSTKKPSLYKRIASKGQIYYTIKFRTWSFSSLNFLYDLFYQKDEKKKYKKIVPKSIEKWCTPRTLAFWFMENASKNAFALRLDIVSFVYAEAKLLKFMFLQKFSLHCSIQCHKKKWILYFSKKQLPLLSKISKAYFLPCMYYKLIK